MELKVHLRCITCQILIGKYILLIKLSLVSVVDLTFNGMKGRGVYGTLERRFGLGINIIPNDRGLSWPCDNVRITISKVDKVCKGEIKNTNRSRNIQPKTYVNTERKTREREKFKEVIER